MQGCWPRFVGQLGEDESRPPRRENRRGGGSVRPSDAALETAPAASKRSPRADERFRTDAPRVRERDHRLEEDAQLAALERAVQGVLGRVSSERSGAHGLVEDIDAASAAVFAAGLR